MIRVVATASNETEAAMIQGRLADAGIRAVTKRNIGVDLPQLGGGGARDIYVEEQELVRARELLTAPEFTDDELAELSEQAYHESYDEGAEPA